MKTRISALMDGELEAHEIASTFDALRRDPSLREEWSDFHCVREALRSESAGATDITARVLAALENEPTVLMPVAARRTAWRHPLMALAASFAGIAVVGWVGFGGTDMKFAQPEAVASLTNATNVAHVKLATVSVQKKDSRLSEYVVAHQAHGSANAFVGNTRYVRTVASVSEGH